MQNLSNERLLEAYQKSIQLHLDLEFILLLDKHTKKCLECRLLAEIENNRELMILTAFEKGFTDPQTIMISQNLDQLLNKLGTTNLGLNCTAI